MLKYTFAVGFSIKFLPTIIMKSLTQPVYIFTELRYIPFEFLLGLININFFKGTTVDFIEFSGLNGNSYVKAIVYLGETYHDEGLWHKKQDISRHDTVLIRNVPKYFRHQTTNYGANLCII